MNRDMYGISNFFVLERSGQDFPVTLYFIINTELRYEDGVYLWQTLGFNRLISMKHTIHKHGGRAHRVSNSNAENSNTLSQL